MLRSTAPDLCAWLKRDGNEIKTFCCTYIAALARIAWSTGAFVIRTLADTFTISARIL